jgi:ubiquinone/menaquinone biosynthesis C-methylase UbiE
MGKSCSEDCGCSSSPKVDSKGYFEEVADKWDQMRENFFPESVRETAYQAAKVESGTVAADFGAGTGFVTEGLLKLGVSVIAVDQSESMLEVLKQRLSGLGRFDCRIGHAELIPIEDGSVDYGFANMFLHHVDDPAAAITEMVRTIKPGGRLVITDLDEHDFSFLKEEQYDKWMGFKRDDVRRWFVEAGLKDIALDCVGADCCSKSECGCSDAKISIFVATGTK